jgi:hypothetical protein
VAKAGGRADVNVDFKSWRERPLPRGVVPLPINHLTEWLPPFCRTRTIEREQKFFEANINRLNTWRADHHVSPLDSPERELVTRCPFVTLFIFFAHNN